MYNSAQTAKDVDVYLQGTVSLLNDLKKLITLKINGQNVIKAVTNPSALDKVNLVDLKLNVQGPLEDDVYALFPILIKNIRRGNTVLRIENEEED